MSYDIASPTQLHFCPVYSSIVPYNYHACLADKISCTILETFQKHVFLPDQPKHSKFASLLLLSFSARSFTSVLVKSLLFLLLSLFLSTLSSFCKNCFCCFAASSSRFCLSKNKLLCMICFCFPTKMLHLSALFY